MNFVSAKNMTKKNMTAAIALASALGLNTFTAMAETQPAAKPAQPAAAAPSKPAPAAAQTAAPAKPAAAAEVPVVAAEPAAAPEAAPEAAAAPAEEAPAPAAAEAAPEAAPAAPAKAVEAPAPAKPEAAAAAPAKVEAATGSAVHQVSLGSVVVGADGKEVGTVNRVRTEASGKISEIHVQGKAGVVSVPGNKIASGGQNVKLSLTADEVSKLPALGGGRS